MADNPQQLFWLNDYEGQRQLIEVSYLADAFDMEVQNQIGKPVVFTLREKAKE